MSSAVLPRLLVVAEPASLPLARQIAASGYFETRLLLREASSPEPQRPHLLERLYRRLDRKLFSTRRARSAWAPTVPATEHDPEAEFDLRVELTGEPLASHEELPTLRLRLAGLPPTAWAEAVRAMLDQPGGTLALDWSYANGHAPARHVLNATCFLEHRSLRRSLEQVVLKVPASLLAAMRRINSPHVPKPAAEPEVPRPAWRQLGRLALTAAMWPLHRDQWRIHLYRQGPDQLLQPWVELDPGRRAFWADPFLVRGEGGHLHVLFEALPFSTGRGHIAALTLDAEGRTVAGPKPVLKEDYHLSYPFVFEWEGRCYMIPESSAARTVDLYVCEEMPWRWRKQQTLIEGVRLADATLFQQDGRWWLFAAHAQDAACIYDELYLYWAESPLGPWHPHALNPVKIDARGARPAGALFVHEGRLIRPTQDCSNVYGGGVNFQEVLQLDEQHFEERELYRLALPDLGLDMPVHTINYCDHYLCVDSLRKLMRRP